MIGALRAATLTMRELAMEYATDRKWPVFPCSPVNKKPLINKGFKEASTKPAAIKSWWSSHPDAMIGVPTGIMSGFWVLDIDSKDGKDGYAALAKLVADNGPLPDTLSCTTPTGGKHYYFVHDDALRTSSSAAGIDVRGEGGYIIVPGSVKDDGTFYAWEDEAAEVAVAPPWLIAHLSKPKIKPASTPSATGVSNPPYVTGAWTSEIAELSATTTGRNTQLNKAAMALGKLIGPDLSEGKAIDLLIGASVANGYVAKDGMTAVRKTINSGLGAGMTSPRAIPPPASSFQYLPPVDAEWLPANDNVKLTKVKGQIAVKDDSINAEFLLGMDFPPLEYIIPGYVVEGLTVLGGKPKLGKSWWAYDASIAVATGGLAMGAIPCVQGDVIYLALEDNQRRVKDRLLTLCPARKLMDIKLDRLTIRTIAPTLDKGLLIELDKWRLSCLNPRLIIIDVYMKIRPGRKKGEDAYAADYEAVTPLQRYASENRLAVVLVTHTRKMESDDPLESISGTNGVTGAADAVLVLARGAKGTTLYGRGRDIEEIETAIKFDGGRWSILGDAEEVRKSDERRRIIAVVRESDDELTPKAIADLAGMKAVNVRVLLGKMVASGEMLQPRVGYYAVPAPVRVQAS